MIEVVIVVAVWCSGVKNSMSQTFAADSHAAEDYTQSWNYVVDNKTGLFWSQTAEFAISPAAPGCASLTVGGFADWRDPTVAELQALIDLTNGGGGTDRT